MEPLTLAVRVVTTGSVDTEELAAVAARTFPLACPPSIAAENIASFIDTNLSAERFAEYLADPRRAIITAAQDGRIIGYAMLIRDDSTDDAAELSKMYVVPDHHGAGVSTALMERSLATAKEWGMRRVWRVRPVTVRVGSWHPPGPPPVGRERRRCGTHLAAAR